MKTVMDEKRSFHEGDSFRESIVSADGLVMGMEGFTQRHRRSWDRLPACRSKSLRCYFLAPQMVQAGKES